MSSEIIYANDGFYSFLLVFGYLITLAQILFIVSAIYLFKSGFKLESLLMGISTVASLVISVLANITTSEGLTELTNEAGEIYGYAPESSFFETIQYPTYILSIFLVSLSLLILAAKLSNNARKSD